VSPYSRVFVNGVGLDVPPGTTAVEAVRAWDAGAAEAVVRGQSIITDSRGLPAPTDAPLQAGTILRVISARARGASGPRDPSGES